MTISTFTTNSPARFLMKSFSILLSFLEMARQKMTTMLADKVTSAITHTATRSVLHPSRSLALVTPEGAGGMEGGRKEVKREESGKKREYKVKKFSKKMEWIEIEQIKNLH